MKKHVLLVAAGLFLVGMKAAFAGTDGTEFQLLYETVSGWASGYLGRAIALIFLLVGLGVGVIRGSIVGALACIASAMALLVAPSVVEGILTAVI